jgi:prolipoprotein diacylglyceryltransferase
MLWLLPIIAALLWLDRRGARAGLMTAVFAISYGTFRFLTDFLREYDQTLLGLTGAQYGCILLVGVGVWLLVAGRSEPAADPADVDQADSPSAPS